MSLVTNSIIVKFSCKWYWFDAKANVVVIYLNQLALLLEYHRNIYKYCHTTHSICRLWRWEKGYVIVVVITWWHLPFSLIHLLC